MLRSKIAIVILGALFVGGVTATIGILSTEQPRPALTGAVVTSSAPGTSSTASPTASASVTPTAAPTNTSVPTPVPTRVPPTPTPIPVVGQTLTLQGSIGSINSGNQSFVLNVRGGSYTCQATSNTTFQINGTAGSFSGLQTSMQADVVGVYQGGGNLTANSVNAQIDN